MKLFSYVISKASCSIFKEYSLCKNGQKFLKYIVEQQMSYVHRLTLVLMGGGLNVSTAKIRVFSRGDQVLRHLCRFEFKLNFTMLKNQYIQT